MPQGKGTYGSLVGRPKKKYNKGGSVSMNADPFSTRNEEGVPAEQMAEAMENQNMANEGLPTANAQERSQVSPDVTEYKEGGKVKSKKVDITDVVSEVYNIEGLKKPKLAHSVLSGTKGLQFPEKKAEKIKKIRVGKMKKEILK